MAGPTRVWIWAAAAGEHDAERVACRHRATERVTRLLQEHIGATPQVVAGVRHLPADAEVVVLLATDPALVGAARGRSPRAALVVASAGPGVEEIVRLLEAGVQGVLDLGAGDDELAHGLRAVVQYGTSVPTGLRPAVAARLVERRAGARQRCERLARLSAVELEILLRLADGLDRTAVARERGEPVSLVRTRIARAIAKLGVRSQRQAVALLTDAPDNRSARHHC